LAFRWDGRRTRFFFQTRPGTYTDRALITFLRALRRHFRRQRVILIWDGLGAHKSGRMRTYLAQQTHWLRVEPLPAYAPDLNPVEPLWGNVKSQEMANVCAPDLSALRRPLRAGLTRAVVNSAKQITGEFVARPEAPFPGAAMEAELRAAAGAGRAEFLDATRLAGALCHLQAEPRTARLPVGLFGASTGAASALRVAAGMPHAVGAVVSRGGRPDLAGKGVLASVKAPTLLIVGAEDHGVIELNEQALDMLGCEREMVLVPGATHLFEEPGTLEEVARLAGEWFARYLASP